MLIKATEFQDSEIPSIREKYFNPEKEEGDEESVALSDAEKNSKASPGPKEVTVEFVS